LRGGAAEYAAKEGIDSATFFGGMPFLSSVCTARRPCRVLSGAEERPDWR